MQCTIDIFRDNGWQACCTVALGDPVAGKDSPAVITFHPDLLSAGNQTPSLRLRAQSTPLELSHWPSFLVDLIPQGDGRAYLHDVLELPEGQASDWRMLVIGAINPVGKIRVREAATAYYERMQQLEPEWSEQGFTTEEVLSRSEAFSTHFDAHGIFSAGATSVQGLAPKLLLTQGKDGLWYADATLPDNKAARHYILKFSRARNMADWTILKHEVVYMRLAKEMGLFVAELPEWKNDMLFVPRFDRQVVADRVIRHHQESLLSLSGLIDPHTATTHNRMLEALRQYTSNPYEATLEYIRRDIMNLALGNTDNSPYNMAVQIINGKTGLTPLYDFAPMYLDMDDLSRTLEWVDESGNELTNWADILHVLPLTTTEKAALREALHAFGKRMEGLEALMVLCGVSDDIMTDRYYGIQNQCWQLRELQAGG